MKTHTNIEQQVMAGVGVVYMVRQLTCLGALKVYALMASIVGLVLLVSLPHVAANFMLVAHGGVISLGNYVWSAVLSTTVMVQLVLMVGVVAGTSLLTDSIKSAGRGGGMGHLA